MAITADWPNAIFTVPKADLTLIQASPTEVRGCDINWLRLEIMALEDDVDGMTFPTVFTHYPEVDLGSLLLAKSILMNEPYTITFEDGQYAVNLTGANSNYGDRVNVNQVSIRSANSAGLVSNSAGLANAVWDEPLTGTTHSIPTSAGRRLRAIASQVIIDGTALGPGLNGNQIILDTDAADFDGAYDPALIAIVEGTGVGQSRLLLEYEGSARVATVDRSWKVLPDATSGYVIIANPGREHVNEGLAQTGGLNTITLNALASDNDDAYKGQTIFLRSGLGEDQACKVISYDGTTKIATVCTPWGIVPDSTTAYVVLPTGMLDMNIAADVIADTVWGTPDALKLVEEFLGNVVVSPDDLRVTIRKRSDDTISHEFGISADKRARTVI